MTAAAEILQTFEQAGFTLEPVGAMLRVNPVERLTPEQRETLKQYKPAILRELRRRQALRLLAENPEKNRAYIVDPDSDPDRILVLLALRGVGSCDLEIPRDRWDPFLFMKFLESRHQ